MRHNVSEILNIIKDRRTIKPEHFSSREVHPEILEKMLDAARWAPTHGLTQPWQFQVFRKGGLQTLSHFHAETYKNMPQEEVKVKNIELLQNRISKASAVISIAMKRQETEKIPELEEIEAVACAVQNMCLVATAYGIGTYWSTGGLVYTESMKTFLGLQEKDRCLGLLYIGYPELEWPLGQRRPSEYYSKWIES